MRHLKTEEWVKIFNAYDDFKNRKISKFEFEQISFSVKQNYWNKESLKRMLRKRKMYNLNTQSKTGKASKKGEGVGRRKGKFLTIRELIPLKMMKKMQQYNTITEFLAKITLMLILKILKK